MRSNVSMFADDHQVYEIDKNVSTLKELYLGLFGYEIPLPVNYPHPLTTFLANIAYMT